MPSKTCEKCGGPLPVHKGRHRPRKFCTICRPPRLRNNPNTPAAVIGTIGRAGGVSSLVQASEERLRATGHRDDPEGVLVMTLAASIDAGGHSGASLAALSREYARALAAASAEGEARDAGDGIDWQIG